MKNLIFLLFFLLCFSTLSTYAQCPMCRSAVESAMKEEGNSKGMGLNNGILYLLATPYIAVAAVGGAWFYKKRLQK